MLCSARYSRGRLTERTRGELEEVREGEEEGGEGERKPGKERGNAAPLDFQDIHHYHLITVFFLVLFSLKSSAELRTKGTEIYRFLTIACQV